DTARWMLKLGWPKRISSAGGIYVQKQGKSNISDTQTAVFEYDGFNAVWQHRTWGTPPDPDYPWALSIYGENGTLKASTMTANIAMDLARPLVYDPGKRVVVDDPDATKRLRREYRQPWRHPSQA